MKNNIKTAIFSALLFFANYSFSGIVEQLEFEGQPIVSLKNGDVNGCGFRIFGSKLVTKNSKVLGIDVSFNFFLDGLAMVKGGLRDIDVRNVNATMLADAIPIKSFWIKAKNNKATHPRGDIVMAILLF